MGMGGNEPGSGGLRGSGRPAERLRRARGSAWPLSKAVTALTAVTSVTDLTAVTALTVPTVAAGAGPRRPAASAAPCRPAAPQRGRRGRAGPHRSGRILPRPARSRGQTSGF